MSIPSPEDLYEDLSAAETAQIERLLARERAVEDGIGGAFLLYRDFMSRRLEAQRENYTEPGVRRQLAANLQSLADKFAPLWLRITSPLLAAAYIRGLRATGILLPRDTITEISEQYSYQLGNYLHRMSADAVIRAFSSQVNRKVGYKEALRNVFGSYGLTQKTMNTLVNVWGTEEPKRYTDRVMESAKQRRAHEITVRELRARAKLIGEQEGWNAREQAKQMSWMYAQRTGVIPTDATRVWVTAKDEKVCAYCGPLNGAEIPINEKFETSIGNFWSPPAHINCRCEVKLKSNLLRTVSRELLSNALTEDLSKAYEERPWARYQPRDEEGQWVKTLSLEPNTVVSDPVIEIPRFVDVPEEGIKAKAEPRPTHGIQARPEVPPPRHGISARPEPKPQPPAPSGIAAKPEVPRGIAARPETPAGIAAKEETPVRGIKAIPEERPVEEELEEPSRRNPYRRFSPHIEQLPYTVYGVAPSVNWSKTTELHLQDTRMTPDLDSLADMVEEEFNSRIAHYVAQRTGTANSISGFQIGMTNYMVDEEQLAAAMQWAHARQYHHDTTQWRHDAFYDRHAPDFDSDAEITVFRMDDDDQIVRTETVRMEEVVEAMELTDVLNELTPHIVSTRRINHGYSSGEEISRHESEFDVTGNHRVLEDMGPLITEDGRFVANNIWEIDPTD